MWHSFRFSFNLGNFQASRYASDPAGHLRVWSVRSVGRPRRVGDGGGVADGAEAGLAAEADLIALVGEVGGCKEGRREELIYFPGRVRNRAEKSTRNDFS